MGVFEIVVVTAGLIIGLAWGWLEVQVYNERFDRPYKPEDKS